MFKNFKNVKNFKNASNFHEHSDIIKILGKCRDNIGKCRDNKGNAEAKRKMQKQQFSCF